MIIPKVPGIYQFICNPNGRVYIGSAINLYERHYNHLNELKRNSHHNILFQRAWIKYGADAFVFSVLELVAPDQLIEREQYWMDTTQCYKRDKGFNILEKARSGAGMKMPTDVIERQRLRSSKTWEGFIDPEGNLVSPITNLRSFCIKQGLSPSAMQQLAHGDPRFQSHKGWTHRDSPPRKPKPVPPVVDNAIVWTGFIDPNGNEIEPIIHLESFCRERGLEPANMRSMAYGRRAFHHGWSHVNAKPKTNGAETWEGFINPLGKSVTITNLAAFCRENGLTMMCMRMLITGRLKNHRGWRYTREII